MKKQPSKKARASKRPGRFPRSVSTAKEWARFGKRLALVLADVDEDEFLIISGKKRPVYIQFSAQGHFGMRAEAVSNNYLTGEYRLSKEDHTPLREIGWRRPRSSRSEPADGSLNFYLDADTPIAFDVLADAAVRTLRNVYRTGHPGNLQYKAFGSDSKGFGADEYKIRFPTLGLKRVSE